MNTLSAFSSLAIFGVAVSLIVQLFKQHPKLQANAPWILVVTSIVGGIAYFFLEKLNNWPAILESILTIAAYANGFYLLVIQWFEGKSTTN